jgi:hypothetical protein
MRKMRLVPADVTKLPEDVQLKLIQNVLATRIPKNENYGYEFQPTRSLGIQTQDTVPRSVQTEGVPVQDIGIQGKTAQSVDVQTDETETQNVFVQTKSLTNILVKRYTDKVNQIVKLLEDRNYRWNLGDLKMREPPDVDVVPVFEHLVTRLLRITSPTINQIEKTVFPTIKRPSPPKQPMKRTSPATAGRDLLRQQSAFDAKRARMFDKMSKPFEE